MPRLGMAGTATGHFRQGETDRFSGDHPSLGEGVRCISLSEAVGRGRLPLCHTTALRIVYSTQLMVGRDTVTNTCYDQGRFREPSLGSIGIVRFHQSAGPIAACAPISQIRSYGTPMPEVKGSLNFPSIKA
jgi:hypothetical protein